MTTICKLAITSFIVAAAVSVFATNTIDASASVTSTNPQLLRSNDTDGADAPSGRGMLRMPAASGVNANDNTAPGTEDGEPPTEPSDPGTENDEMEPPSFFGEAVSVKNIFIIDVSLSMRVYDVGGGIDYDGNAVAYMTRLMLVKTELINFLRAADDDIWFDIIWLAGGNYPCDAPNTDAWRGELVQCTDEIRQEAINVVRDQGMWAGTPTWRALKRACEDYPDDIGLMVHLTDGAPFPPLAGEWGTDHDQAVYNDFPAWFAPKKANGCNLIGIHVGYNSQAGSFMQEWCAQNDAAYIHR
ncbi:MAG: hypothetical protein HUU29_11890 [Planctomycetaceae bacterium]|nr:hypothetical protein [Planctomycetaceae bacterium]